jgi:hypothetical protein
VEQNDEPPRPSIQDPISRLAEANTQLAKLAFDLGADRVLRRRGRSVLAIQVLLDVIVHLCRRLRVGPRKIVQERVHRLSTGVVAVVDSLRRPGHAVSGWSRPADRSPAPVAFAIGLSNESHVTNRVTCLPNLTSPNLTQPEETPANRAVVEPTDATHNPETRGSCVFGLPNIGQT